MKSGMWKWAAVAGGTALGLGAMALQQNVLREGFDEAGLLVMQNPGLWILWAVTGLYLAGTAVLSWYLGEGGSFEENFPPCLYSGMASVIAGLMMVFTGIADLGDGALQALCVLVIGVGMIMGGICRCCGWKPDWWMDMMIFVGYTAILVWSYRHWNTQPTLQTYGFPMLSIIGAMMFALHRARCPWGYPDRRKMIFFGLAGVYLSFPAMAGEAEPGFFFATAVWCAGALCQLNKQRPVLPEPEAEPEAEPESDPEQEAEPELDLDALLRDTEEAKDE